MRKMDSLHVYNELMNYIFIKNMKILTKNYNDLIRKLIEFFFRETSKGLIFPSSEINVAFTLWKYLTIYQK